MPRKVIFICLIFTFVFTNIFFIFNFSLAQFGLERFSSGDAFPIANQDISGVVGRVVGYVLGIIGIILVVLIIYGGVLYTVSEGNPEQVEKAKKVLTYSIIGVVIIALSFVLSNYIIKAFFTN